MLDRVVVVQGSRAWLGCYIHQLPSRDFTLLERLRYYSQGLDISIVLGSKMLL